MCTGSREISYRGVPSLGVGNYTTKNLHVKCMSLHNIVIPGLYWMNHNHVPSLQLQHHSSHPPLSIHVSVMIHHWKRNLKSVTSLHWKEPLFWCTHAHLKKPLMCRARASNVRIKASGTEKSTSIHSVYWMVICEGLQKDWASLSVANNLDMGEFSAIIMALPVHIPDDLSSSPLTHVFPDPGKLSNGTGALLLPFMKLQADFWQPLQKLNYSSSYCRQESPWQLDMYMQQIPFIITPVFVIRWSKILQMQWLPVEKRPALLLLCMCR